MYPTLEIEENEALTFIEELLIKLMSSVLDKNPHSVHDLEKIINSILPNPINEYANKKAKHALDECSDSNFESNNSLIQNSKVNKIVNLVANPSSINHQSNLNLTKCSLVFNPIIKQIQTNCKLDLHTSIYLTAFLEYFADDIFKLACKYVENTGNQAIKTQDVKIALNADSLLMYLFYGKNDEENFSLINDLSILELDDCSKQSENENLNYQDIVKELIKEERLFLRELNLIIKVFREPFIRLLNTSVPNTPTATTSSHSYSLLGTNNNQSTITSCESNQTTFTQFSINSSAIYTNQLMNDDSILREEDVDLIFSNVTDIYEFSINFLSLLEDTIEMNEKNEGKCIFF